MKTMGNTEGREVSVFKLQVSIRPRDAIGRLLFLDGLRYWERETPPAFRNLLKTSRYYLDAGANLGVYTLDVVLEGTAELPAACRPWIARREKTGIAPGYVAPIYPG
jgi:hypothetical protein